MYRSSVRTRGTFLTVSAGTNTYIRRRTIRVVRHCRKCIHRPWSRQYPHCYTAMPIRHGGARVGPGRHPSVLPCQPGMARCRMRTAARPLCALGPTRARTPEPRKERAVTTEVGARFVDRVVASLGGLLDAEMPLWFKRVRTRYVGAQRSHPTDCVGGKEYSGACHRWRAGVLHGVDLHVPITKCMQYGEPGPDDRIFGAMPILMNPCYRPRPHSLSYPADAGQRVQRIDRLHPLLATLMSEV
jgi:hypothetical protein